MEKKTDALVLRSTDYKDNDKILTLFSADEGKITAVARGVKKHGARLRFAAEPFAFAEYVFACKGGRNTVISASSYDGFYPIREDIVKYYAACSVCEVCDSLLYEGIDGRDFFFKTVTALKDIAYSSNTGEVVVKFMLEATAFSGFTIDLSRCGECGALLKGRVYFDFSTGRFSCGECGKGTAVSGKTYEYLKKLSGAKADVDDEKDAQRRALRLLNVYFKNKTETENSSLGEFIKML